ncbi:hypothetical protein P43SY_002809 [Pythium insidiosum]|uniref:RRM domain-containing protein n=1 Tax=Pythium insidiosum TaxID=114742 RepID=A0AAD5QAJ8_PYTIN|nr:hypothetical protein P43SY_002809 [Pythium insidiosum]
MDSAPAAATPSAPEASDVPPRLFVVCGRDRTVEELRELFASCGAIRQLHVATDRCNKSRGFAFLQYERAADAHAAIQRFDQMRLSDGHILKVTIAREKGIAMASSQTASHHAPGKLKRNQHSQDEVGDKAEAVEGHSGFLPGKRQRSSPPSTGAQRRADPALTTIMRVWQRSTSTQKARTARSVPRAVLRKPSPAEPVEEVVAQVLEDLVGAVERATVSFPVVHTHAAKRKAPMTTSAMPSTHQRDREASPDVLLSSGISSVRLDSDPRPKSHRTGDHSTPHDRSHRHVDAYRHFQRRQRQMSVDDSDSSGDDASDASVKSRRKRSNTEPADTSASRRRLSDLSELTLSSTTANTSSPIASKKRCSHHRNMVRPGVPPVTIPGYVELPAATTASTSRSKLFFTSTHKFTQQELQAVFGAYDDLEYVQIVKSFGRVKTMAYVKYTTAAAATAVLASFLEDHDDKSADMKLTFADESAEASAPAIARIDEDPDRVGLRASACYGQWVLLLYDRGLTNEAISSCVAACDGMEHVDIKVFGSTGESQGIAYVKFATDRDADAAAQRLHNLEFPRGSRKFLQAVRIDDPRLFSTPHSAAAAMTRPPPSRTTREDGDLGAVEARFAHLMTSCNGGAASTNAGDSHVLIEASSGNGEGVGGANYEDYGHGYHPPYAADEGGMVLPSAAAAPYHPHEPLVPYTVFRFGEHHHQPYTPQYDGSSMPPPMMAPTHLPPPPPWTFGYDSAAATGSSHGGWWPTAQPYGRQRSYRAASPRYQDKSDAVGWVSTVPPEEHPRPGTPTTSQSSASLGTR